MNFHSPTIGRFGAGHNVPAAGFDPRIDQVLLSEVNQTANGKFSVFLPALCGALRDGRVCILMGQGRNQERLDRLIRMLRVCSGSRFNYSDFAD